MLLLLFHLLQFLVLETMIKFWLDAVGVGTRLLFVSARSRHTCCLLRLGAFPEERGTANPLPLEATV